MSTIAPVPNKEIENFRYNLEVSFERGLDLSARIIRLTEDISEEHFQWFDTAMTELERLNRKTITVKINSYGGDVYAALGIIGRMKESPCKIVTKAYGKVMSAGTLILAAGNERLMSRYCSFMDHQMSYGVDGTHGYIKGEVEANEILSDLWYKTLEEFTGTKVAVWKNKYNKAHNVYLTPDQCVKLNLVDRLF